MSEYGYPACSDTGKEKEMIKKDELSNPDSCMSRAKDDEMTFVLLARDVCAPAAIRAWINARIKAGKNKSNDEQIINAIACWKAMERQQMNRTD